MDTLQIVKEFYNSCSQGEWNRIEGRPEFILTCRFIERYVKPGDTVLDIGGGPGRYSIYLAKKGCDVALFDLAEENILFAKSKAAEQGVKLKTATGDAKFADTIFSEQFDHILLMGPMYHLLEETERIMAVNSSLKLLKTDGVLFVSFINMIAGMIYAMKYKPDIVSDPIEKEFNNIFIANKSFSGAAFTQAYFAKQDEVIPFMEQFPLEKLHFFGQEGITSPCENNIMSQPEEIIDLWLDICEKTCEREELLSWSEHLMYIGRKKLWR